MPRSLSFALISILFIFICLFAFFKIFGPIPFFVQNVNTSKASLFTVDGTGDMSIIPDTAMISLGVSKTETTVDTAQNEVNAISNKITQDLKNLGINVKDIKTTNYSVNPQYDYSMNSQKITGYIVSEDIEVKLQPIDKANAAIDLATNDGANQVGGVQFVVDDAKQKELENEARAKAIADAKQKAQTLANAAGMHLGRIVDIQENSQGINPRPYPVMMDAAVAKTAGAPTQLNPGENKVTSTVTLSYETY